DGDGLADICVWRETIGTFYYIRSSDNVVAAQPWGQQGDEPAPRDYDGDNKTDFAVVRRTAGSGSTPGQMTWYILQSMTGSLRVENFGISTDFIAPGDYDGDGKFDVAVQRGSDMNGPATFYILQSTAGFTAIQWGLSNDFVVPGDYDNDGKTDLAVLRDANGSFQWYIRQSGSGGSLLAVTFGTSMTDTSVQNDYDGDGKCDVAVFRDNGTSGTFYIRKTSDGSLIVQPWGTTTDFPVASFDTH
ncbi:MAG: VCBS repeat-containing protein, partial [Acidobacteria bacterium]|nr:VCBS repeat-containing protein [Acidobacteriota bacterium]